MIDVDRSLSCKKSELLDYFRQRAAESLQDIRRTYGSTEYRKQASLINKALTETKDLLVKALLQRAEKEKWSNEEILRCILMLTYTNDVVMLEYRNEVWPYEYMTFSRRIGELWERFCGISFEYPINEIQLFVPPLFSEVRKRFTTEIEDFIDQLNITQEQKIQLKRYYNKVWGLVTSGEIKLELDLHFEFGNKKIVIDLKSGFGSNEKGNTNRLLLVASIYKNLEENYKCIILVRSEEDMNNNYFQTLKNSGIWEAYCGKEAYGQIKKYSGFDLKLWINENVNWKTDFRQETREYLIERELEQYLEW